MRFIGFAVVASAIVLGACGDKSAATTDSTAATAAVTDTTPATPATGTGVMAPITGTTHEVKMIGDAQGYRFDPANITIKQGDGIKFTFVNGGPHNVAFDAATLSPEAKAALLANMPEQQGELSGKMLMAEGETYTISFAGVPAGTYDYVCTPHLAMNMKGKITVQ
jgi:plastocyanin